MRVLSAISVSSLAIGVQAFAVRQTIHPSFSKPSRPSLYALHSSTLPTDQAVTANGDSEDSRKEASKQKAVEALERLLQRQKADVEETKRLLELYESQALSTGDFVDAATNGDGVIENGEQELMMGVAGSVLRAKDYGFVSRSEGASFPDLKTGNPNAEMKGYGPPANIWKLGSKQFMRNLMAMRNEYEEDLDNAELTPEQEELQEKLHELTLNSTAIWERELKDGPIEAPWIIKAPYFMLCYMLDIVFEERYVPSRFFLLETVARMPYFSYIGMLHVYETLGFWRRSADMKRIHFAEEMNEFNHLQIMESLGGDQRWWVRLMAQHSAIAYFMGLCILWAISPSLSYKFSEMLETHAVNTYSQFLDENEQKLRALPPSLAAIDYYALGAADPYYAEFQTSAISDGSDIRRPGLGMATLYDVFSAIRDDEGDHVSTMEACLDPSVAKLSPSLEKKLLVGIATAASFAYFLGTGEGIDLTDSAISELTTEGIESSGDADAAFAAVAGFLTQVGLRGEEADLVEGGGAAFVALENLARQVAAFLAKIL